MQKKGISKGGLRPEVGPETRFTAHWSRHCLPCSFNKKPIHVIYTLTMMFYTKPKVIVYSKTQSEHIFLKQKLNFLVKSKTYSNIAFNFQQPAHLWQFGSLLQKSPPLQAPCYYKSIRQTEILKKVGKGTTPPPLHLFLNINYYVWLIIIVPETITGYAVSGRYWLTC